MKKFLVFLGVIILCFGLAFWFKRSVRTENGEATMGININENKVELFVSEACSHCKKVEEWLDQNVAIKEKSGLTEKEVYYNKENSQQMITRANECQLDTRQGVGIPFLYDNGECIIGDQPIIDYFEGKYK